MALWNPSYPHLRSTEAGKQLVVNGRPFLFLVGELQNSSLTSAEYMDTVWHKLVGTQFNTVLLCAIWETIEPIGGQFTFNELGRVILGTRELGAKKHRLRLALL